MLSRSGYLVREGLRLKGMCAGGESGWQVRSGDLAALVLPRPFILSGAVRYSGGVFAI